MRHVAILIAAAAFAAGPALAQPAESMDNVVAANAVDPALAAGDPAMDSNAVDPLAEPADLAPTMAAPGLDDATVTPDDDDDGGFPWGLVGLVGLIGLIGRFRS